MDTGFLKEAHNEVFEKNKTKLPSLKLIDVLKYISAYLENPEAVKKQNEQLTKQFKSFGNAYLSEMAEKLVERALADAENNPVIKNLSEDDFSQLLIQTGKQVIQAVRDYAQGKINEEGLVERLFGSDISQVAARILTASGIDINEIKKNPGEILRLSSPTVMYHAFAAAFEELKKSYEDLAVARENRIQIEEACNESIRLIKAYREEMEERVSAYLCDHMDAFEKGFRAMDQAILDDDTEGFIRGNVLIQEALGYNVQFKNQEEFDDLMDSDDAFIF